MVHLSGLILEFGLTVLISGGGCWERGLEVEADGLGS